jgi:hypothetical protein
MKLFFDNYFGDRYRKVCIATFSLCPQTPPYRQSFRAMAMVCAIITAEIS